MPRDLMADLAIQSWCFRGFKTHDEVIDALGQCGVKNLELSNAHYNPAAASDHAAVIRYYADRGVNIPTYGALWIDDDEAAARAGFEFARTAGFDTLVFLSTARGVPIARKLADEFQIRAAFHNHGREMFGGPPWEIEAAIEGSPYLGLCLDTAWMLDSGFDPVEIAQRFSDRLFAVHVKDFVFDRAGKPSDVVVGTGNLDLPALLKLLLDTDFSGPFTLEYEGDIDDPVPATRQCVEAIRSALASL